MTQKTLLPILLLTLAVLGAIVWSLADEPGQTQALEGSNSVPLSSTSDGPAKELGAATQRILQAPTVGQGSQVTTVVIPLVIELELVAAKARLVDDSAPALGSAASAHIRGSMHAADGSGLKGYAEFIAGPNIGRILETDREGRFGANDLYAGLSLIALRAPGVPGAEREVLLREGKDSQLNVGFGRPASVRGIVKDLANVPLPLAKVVMDGQEVMTDKDGQFYFPRMTSGKVPIYVSKPGYATHREMQFITAGMSIPLGKLRYNLKQAATLSVTIPERIGGPGPGKLYISGPLDGTASRTYPWHLKSPISMHGGESIEIEDLPAGRIRLQYFRTGAITLPQVRHEVLVAGNKRQVEFHLKPAPTLVGKVMMDGEPVEGALVQFEMPDVTGASVKALGGSYGRVQVEMDILSQMPPAMQKAVSLADGGFVFSSAESYSSVRYLTARSANGKAWGGRTVRPGELKVDIELSEALVGGASLVVETSTRFQALPVSYMVNGKPRKVVLSAAERLTIPDLPEGDWVLNIRWQNESILKDMALTLSGPEELFLPLPEGAINGQAKSLRDAMQ